MECQPPHRCHSDYDVVNGMSSMFFHAQVYGLADKYIIPSLKNCSMSKFGMAISSGWQLDDFPSAIVEVYDSTPDTDRGLRDVIVEVATQNVKKLIKNSLFDDALREKPTFAADMVKALSSEVKHIEKAKCPNCKKIMAGVPSKGSYYCMHCASHRADWASYVIHE
jgi:speckle-type POZ protein